MERKMDNSQDNNHTLSKQVLLDHSVVDSQYSISEVIIRCPFHFVIRFLLRSFVRVYVGPS